MKETIDFSVSARHFFAMQNFLKPQNYNPTFNYLYFKFGKIYAAREHIVAVLDVGSDYSTDNDGMIAKVPEPKKIKNSDKIEFHYAEGFFLSKDTTCFMQDNRTGYRIDVMETIIDRAENPARAGERVGPTGLNNANLIDGLNLIKKCSAGKGNIIQINTSGKKEAFTVIQSLQPGIKLYIASIMIA